MRDLYQELRIIGLTSDQCFEVSNWLKTLPVYIDGQLQSKVLVNVDDNGIKVMPNNLNLEKGDYIAFGYNYYGGEPNEIIVANITYMNEGSVLCHFLSGHHSVGEFVNYNDILAVGYKEINETDMPDTIGIKGWSGKFIMVKQTPLLVSNLK